MSNEKVLTEEIKLQRRCSGLCWCCNEKKELLQKLELYKNERDYKSERNGVNCIERDQLREKLRVAVGALEKYSHVKGQMAEGGFDINDGIGVVWDMSMEQKPIPISSWAKEALAKIGDAG